MRRLPNRSLVCMFAVLALMACEEQTTCLDCAEGTTAMTSGAVNGATSSATTASGGGSHAGGTGGHAGEAGGCGTASGGSGGGTCAGVTTDLGALNGCTVALPSGFMPGKINIEYLPGSSPPQVVPLAPCGASQCGAVNAWYYDAQKAMQAVLCPTTCATVQADPAGTLRAILGCNTLTL